MKIVNFKVFQGRSIYSHKKCIKLNLDLEGYNEIPNNEVETTYIAYACEHIIISLHNMVGVKTSYGEVSERCGESYYVIYEYEYRNTGIEAGNIAVDLINSLINKELFDLDLRLNKLKEILKSEQLRINTLNICNEAKKRGIPILKIGESNMFQLGYGKYSNIIQETLSSNTSAIGVDISQDKLLTKEILKLHFIPVASGMKVRNKTDCILVAKDIGYPVVLKPQFGNIGKGVTNNIKDEQELLNAYELLIKDYDDIIIEKYVSGRNYRVVCVYGDIVEVSDLSTGGFTTDCTELICEENLETCKRAASAVGLDICEINLTCNDISNPLDDGDAIIQISATPNTGTKRNIAGHIIDKLFKDIPKNIPLVAITGTNGKTTTTRLIAHILSIAGYTVGMTTTSGIYIAGKCIFKGDTTGPKSALAVLTNKNIDAAVLETARGGIIRQGLAYDLADVGVITNITGDHLGIDGIQTIEDLAKVKALVGEAVKENGYVVINGDDNTSISILHRLKSNLIIFSNNKNNEVMRTNIKKGGYGVYVDEGNIIIQKGTNFEKLIEIKNVGITIKGILKYNIENAMAACGAAIGLGIDYDTIRQGLMSFYCNQDQNPGRFNVYFVNDVMVILDYGHNIEGYKCVLDGIKHIEHNKLIGVIGVPGDRLDSDILEVGKCAGENFDYIFIKEDEDRRGRAKGVVADLLEKGVLKANFHSMNVEKVLVEAKAFKMALDFAEPEDIIIVFFDKPELLIDIMKSKLDETKSEIKLLIKS